MTTMGMKLLELNLDQGIGQKIAARRHQMHWSQVKLAHIIGCSRQTISAYEGGEVSVPAARLKRILHALSVDDNFAPRHNSLSVSAEGDQHHGNTTTAFRNRGHRIRPRPRSA